MIDGQLKKIHTHIMNDTPIKVSLKLHQMKNRMKRLTLRERNKENPLNPRQILRLNELRGFNLK